MRHWHWAHKGRRNCDSWWENETEWHRNWKSRFPDDWTEVVLQDVSGERHIADVKTSYGLVVEFQHSHIDDRERISREKFYEKMIWVVDGNRLKRDRPDFLLGMDINRKSWRNSEYFVFNGHGRQITKRWENSEKLVFLDFGDDQLWCISPKRVNWKFFAARVPKTEFAEAYRDGDAPRVVKHLLEIN